MDRLPTPDERGVSRELLDEDSDVRQIATDELLWYDDHFGEPPERMFNSLQLGGSSAAYDYFESPQHHSLDDVSRQDAAQRLRMNRSFSHDHQHSARAFTADPSPDYRDDDDDDDDDIDIDIESMKNKLLSAWTNAKNG